ncbi:hypothetical protein PTI98_008205 [Pleurotus ostreatus]|nr:hypothetical protein PTI98_008205 [Pleurotus ostreatus]
MRPSFVALALAATLTVARPVEDASFSRDIAVLAGKGLSKGASNVLFHRDMSITDESDNADSRRLRHAIRRVVHALKHLLHSHHGGHFHGPGPVQPAPPPAPTPDTPDTPDTPAPEPTTPDTPAPDPAPSNPAAPACAPAAAA